jgi:hypothetical protein
MTESIVSQGERRSRRERRQAGLLGLGVLASSVSATVVMLLLGPAGAHGAVTHHQKSPATRTAAPLSAAVAARASAPRSAATARLPITPSPAVAGTRAGAR